MEDMHIFIWNIIRIDVIFRYNEVRANAGIDCCIILVGNKLDQRHIRAVLHEDAKRYAEERNIQYEERDVVERTKEWMNAILDMWKRRL